MVIHWTWAMYLEDPGHNEERMLWASVDRRYLSR